MNENIDLTKILKDCPKGTEFYSCIYGKVHFSQLQPCEYPVLIMRGDGLYASFSRVGKYTDAPDSECCLFPSKDQRDWSKFTAPWYKKEKLVEPKFKVGDKIVNVPMKYWGASVTQGIISKVTENKYIFTDGSHMFINNQDSWNLVLDEKPKFDPKTLQPFDKVLVRDSEGYKWNADFYSYKVVGRGHRCVDDIYDYCIPYNDATKHLVGTTDEAPEYYRYWEG